MTAVTGRIKGLVFRRRYASVVIAMLALTGTGFVAPSLGCADSNNTLGAPVYKTASVNGVDLAYQEIGSGEPLIWITGYGGSMDLWSPRLLQDLSASYRIIIFDNRGMGHSTSSDKEYSIPLFASDTLGLMDALQIEKATIVGWSMGTMIAQELTLDHPERVTKLILIAGSPGGKERIATGPEEAKLFADNSGTAQERGMRFIGLMFPPDWLASHPNIPSYFPIGTTINPVDRVQRQRKAIDDWTGSFSRLGQISAPTLILVGDSDVIIAPENSLLLTQGIRDSWLIRIQHAGHGLIFQYPDQISDEILTFLRDAGLITTASR